MATRKKTIASTNSGNTKSTASPVEEMLATALELGNNNYKTGRYLVTFEEGAGKEGLKFLGKTQDMRIADARDFNNQAAILESIGDADAVILPEIGVALVSSDAAQERNMGIQSEHAADGIKSIDPEYFVFAENGSGAYIQEEDFTASRDNTLFNSRNDMPHSNNSAEYLRGFLRAAETIANGILQSSDQSQIKVQEEVQVLGATWGLNACKVPQSVRSGFGIKVAVLDDGLDVGHPDFAGRTITTANFAVGGLPTHGTHMIGTACGAKAPAGAIPRYGIAFKSHIFAGQVINGFGMSTTAVVLSGMNWAIANRCPVILLPLAMSGGPLAAYTAAGQAALNNGCLMIAGSSSAAGIVGAPANSPTIMSVGALTQNLVPAAFSPVGKIDIAAPGQNIFSSAPRPILYQTWSGLASAAAHVAGCAALWAETAPNMRGINLWRRLQSSARGLPLPAARVGAGLVQAP